MNTHYVGKYDSNLCIFYTQTLTKIDTSYANSSIPHVDTAVTI